jgi:hypothetical protein
MNKEQKEAIETKIKHLKRDIKYTKADIERRKKAIKEFEYKLNILYKNQQNDTNLNKLRNETIRKLK